MPANILWAINVHDRIDDLRANIAIARKHFGSLAKISVDCNCPRDRIEEFQACGADEFSWTQNVFTRPHHHYGTYEAYNAIEKHITPETNVIFSLHADVFVTDWKLIWSMFDDIEKGKHASLLAVPPDSSGKNLFFGSIDEKALPNDLNAFSVEGYRRIFPWKLEESKDLLWSEVMLGRHIREKFNSDEVRYHTCSNPDRGQTDNFIYQDIDKTGVTVCSIHNFDRKTEMLSSEDKDILRSIGLYPRQLREYSNKEKRQIERNLPVYGRPEDEIRKRLVNLINRSENEQVVNRAKTHLRNIMGKDLDNVIDYICNLRIPDEI